MSIFSKCKSLGFKVQLYRYFEDTHIKVDEFVVNL